MSFVEQTTAILDKIDAAVPAPLAQFDIFPKLPSTYKSRSESRGFLTLFVAALCLLLSLNEFGEYLWGWPDYEFSVDGDNTSNFMNVNVDLIVNMPCRYLSVDLRDALGDRLYLSEGLRRDGSYFDIGQATRLKEHSAALSTAQVVAQSRKSRGFFSSISRWTPRFFRPKYRHVPHGQACRISGSLLVKKVTANLHITTAGHGYASMEHTDHSMMNLSHVITEFSFGPFFPDITQPLDYSFEVTHDPFVAYQYFLHVVPTTYIAPRRGPLHTNQYSVTHYMRTFGHGDATPGIFFKFDLDPLSLTIHQRTTTMMQLLIRVVGVIGGVFVCTSYALRVTNRAVQVVTGADKSNGIVTAESSGVKVGLRQKWGGSALRSRNTGGDRIVTPGGTWSGVARSPSPFGTYSNTPMTSAFSPPMHSPYLAQLGSGSGSPGGASLGAPPIGLGLPPNAFGPGSASLSVPPPPSRSPRLGNSNLPGVGTPPPPASMSSPYSSYSPAAPLPGAPFYAHFPPTPSHDVAGFPKPQKNADSRKDD